MTGLVSVGVVMPCVSPFKTAFGKRRATGSGLASTEIPIPRMRARFARSSLAHVDTEPSRCGEAGRTDDCAAAGMPGS